MKRTPLKKIGRTGKANLEANKIIKEMLSEVTYPHCELNLSGCTRNLYLTIAHRHKRAWYKSDPQKLSDRKQWVIACSPCHNTIEHNKDLTEKVFDNLRGNENTNS